MRLSSRRGPPPFSKRKIFGSPPAGAVRFETCWHDMSRPCLPAPSNPRHAMPPTRSKRACRACCCARDLCDSEGLPLTQEFLAQMIGARRNAVSIVAHAFRQAGLVSYSRGHIEISDIDGLRKTCCECYAAVQRQCDR